MTLKPREQREPPAKMASPPETNGLKVPADFLMVAMPEPRLCTVDSSLSHLAPVTVLSAVTRSLLVTGSIDHEVPAMVASDFRVCAPLWSSDQLLSTSRTLAPAAFACTTTLLLSPGTTLTTSCWLSLS
ncbi:hypothetical protein SAFG77S_11737 [Streptomyces afghaniensis]